MLGALIIVLNVAVIVISVLVAHLTVALVGPRWLPLTAAGMIVFILVVCEITPKTYAVLHAERVALLMAAPAAALTAALRPLVALLNAVARGLMRAVLLRVLGGRLEPAAAAFTDEEIKALVVAGERSGELEEEEKEMIHGVIEFADQVAREVMVPRLDMVCLEASATVREGVLRARETGFSRLPIYEDTVDHIIGVVHARDLLAHLQAKAADAPLREVARPAYFVPEKKKMDDLLREMQRRQVHQAIVIDEYGGTAGLLTIEDLLEQIVGEIFDEHDVEEPEIQMLDERTAIVDARAAVEEVGEAFGVTLPEGDFDTIGGLALDRLGHLPEPGERVRVNGLEITIEQVRQHRIEKIRVVRRDVAPG
jgi:CBS domain containing-hemolysin-like protein